MIPFLSPRAFADFTPDTFMLYIKSLYIAPPVKAPPAEYSVRLNAKGNPVITIRRKPKYVTSAEVNAIAADLGQPLQSVWMILLKRKIEIRVSRPSKPGSSSVNGSR